MLQTQRSLQGLWLKALLFVLFGYAVLGKGFAYLFVGEMVLVMGLFIFLRAQRVMLIFSDPVLLLWGVFAFWGFCRTVPFLPKYAFDALRDSVVWAYGMFALLIVAFVNNSTQISRAFNTYRRFLRWYLPLVPILVVLSNSLNGIMPSLPWGNNIKVISLRAGEAAVHISAAALFLLIFRRRSSEKNIIAIHHLSGFAGWVLAAFIAIIYSRGAAMALMIPIIVASFVQARKIGWKVATFAIVIILTAFLALEVNPFPIHVKDVNITPEHVSKLVGSIVGGDSARGHEGTKEFRLVWWRHIIDYTIFGPYRWTGKGFGVNLATEDGPPGMTAEESSLRSPHNGHMTVLARMGVPGIAIWVALNFVFVFRLFKAYRRASRSGSRFWSGVDLWIICYWLASVINMSFDVQLEGPQGGIWFWSIIGLGVAVLRVQAYEARQLLAQSRYQASADLVSA